MSLLETHGPELKALYEQGWTMPKIAEKFGTSYPTVRTALLKMGVTPRTGGTTGRRPASDLFSETQVEEIRARLSNGENMASIGRAMGTTQTTIDRYAKRLGLHKPRKDLASHAAEITAALTGGTHVDEIAAKFGTTRHTIYSVVDRAGVDAFKAAIERRAAVRPSKAELHKMRHARERARMESDPEFLGQMRAKQERYRDNQAAKYAPAMNAFRANGCVECGDKRSGGLDAHHRDPSQKLFDISKRTCLKVTPEQLEAELAKCDCLCAYCHRIRHFEQGDNKASADSQSKTSLQVAEARTRLAPVFDEFYSTGCWVCGRKHPAGLSAHHVYPDTKSFNVSRAVFWRLSNKLTKSELDKCACLCETCHRLIHMGELECPVEPLQRNTLPLPPSQTK